MRETHIHTNWEKEKGIWHKDYVFDILGKRFRKKSSQLDIVILCFSTHSLAKQAVNVNIIFA